MAERLAAVISQRSRSMVSQASSRELYSTVTSSGRFGFSEIKPQSLRQSSRGSIKRFGSSIGDVEVRGYYRVRGDRLAWKGKRSRGLVLTCDKVTSNDPTTDPQDDIEIDDEYPEPYVGLINAEQHRMISLALKATGVLFIAE